MLRVCSMLLRKVDDDDDKAGALEESSRSRSLSNTNSGELLVAKRGPSPAGSLVLEEDEDGTLRICVWLVERTNDGSGEDNKDRKEGLERPAGRLLDGPGVIDKRVLLHVPSVQ